MLVKFFTCAPGSCWIFQQWWILKARLEPENYLTLVESPLFLCFAAGFAVRLYTMITTHALELPDCWVFSPVEATSVLTVGRGGDNLLVFYLHFETFLLWWLKNCIFTPISKGNISVLKFYCKCKTETHPLAPITVGLPTSNNETVVANIPGEPCQAVRFPGITSVDLD